jgi:hypothetical protein
MQTQRPNRSISATQPAKGTPSTATSKPWLKPTFEQVPLNEALASSTPAGSSDGASAYTS